MLLKALLFNVFPDTFLSDFVKFSLVSLEALICLVFRISQVSFDFVLVEFCFGFDDVTFD